MKRTGAASVAMLIMESAVPANPKVSQNSSAGSTRIVTWQDHQIEEKLGLEEWNGATWVPVTGYPKTAKTPTGDTDPTNNPAVMNGFVPSTEFVAPASLPGGWLLDGVAQPMTPYQRNLPSIPATDWTHVPNTGGTLAAPVAASPGPPPVVATRRGQKVNRIARGWNASYKYKK